MSDGEDSAALDAEGIKKAKAYVRLRLMNLLARREYSVLELERKLGELPYFDEALARLQGQGLQSDLRFAESYLRSKSQQGRGPVRIRQELRQKGIPDAVIAGVFAEQKIDWFAIAADVYQRKYKDIPSVDIREKAKRARFLSGRGFSFDMVNDLLS